METQSLYTLAQQQNIEVLSFSMPNCGSMSIMDDDGVCAIGMDPSLTCNGNLERVHLSHELGHCVTGSFYNIYAAVDHRQKHENRADKWAIRRLIPVSALDNAVAEGCTELYELADRFGVTESFMRKAVCYYVHGNLATELYF